MRGRCRCWMLVVGIVALAVSTAAAPAGQTRTVDSAPAAESWYHTTVLADSAGGALCAAVVCPAVPVNPYPEDTLHVGVAAGEPDSVTVIALPSPGKVPLGGTLTVPVAEADAGTSNAEAARVLACVAIGPFEDVEAGAPEETPEIDCTHSAPAVVDTAEPVTLTVDLAPLAAGWPVAGDLGVALVVEPVDPDDSDDSDDSGASWHLAFSGRDRDVDGAQPISATLMVPATSSAPPPPAPEVATTPPDTPPPPPVAPPVIPAPAVDTSIGPPVLAAPPVESVPPPSVAPRQQPAAPPAEEPAEVPVAAPAVELPYAYPAAWLLPLVLLAGVSGLGHALKQEVLVTADGAEAR